jgi:hypothetical protein
MKNRIKISHILFSAFFLAAILNTAEAQISGYQGKRFSIGYGGNIGYAMFNRNSSGSSLFATSETDFPEKLFSFNYKHQAQMELVLSNNRVLGIQGSYGKTQFKAFDKGDDYDYYYVYNGSTYSTSKSLGKDMYGNMKILTFGLYLKNFSANTAPIGKYWGYKLAMLRYSADLSGLKMPADFPSIKTLDQDYHTSAVFSITKGTSRVYFNRILVDTGFEFGLPFVIPSISSLDWSTPTSTVTMDDKITKRMNNRLWGNFLVNVNVNVSLLAF